MANSHHLEKLAGGVDRWNQWREREHIDRPDLIGANLRGQQLNVGAGTLDVARHRINLTNVDLDGADLAKADLTYADLSGASLKRTSFLGAQLNEVELKGVDATEAVFDDSRIVDSGFDAANLRSARFHGALIVVTGFDGADLRNANFGMSTFLQGSLGHSLLLECDFTFARFWQTYFDGTDFYRARLSSTSFDDVDLSTAKNLEQASHLGGSTIGVDTLYRSNGTIPPEFLRATGLPEEFIAYAASLAVRRPVEFYSCFLSHSTKDAIFCQRIQHDLRAAALRVWYFPEDAAWGRSLWGEIDQAIRAYDKLILVCSSHSLKAGPVIRELERALTREDREHREVVFPITIDDFVFDAWEHPRRDDVLARVVGDFKAWESDPTKYDASLQRLIASLKRRIT